MVAEEDVRKIMDQVHKTGYLDDVKNEVRLTVS